jgi:RNA-directed DNA polymerase
MPAQDRARLLAELGLEPKEAKTRIVHLKVGGAGFDFLGFHHRLVRVTGRRNQRRSVTFLARWPADRAMKHARDQIRALTRRSRLLLRVEVIVDEVNRFLHGWAAYFRYGNSAVRFEKIMHHVWTRIALVIAKRHKRSRAYGWSVLAYQSPDHFGLISLSGTVVAPRPFKDWREKPNAGGERRR